ncbi:unnamed protein product [Colias eurytheme]|nr:unnamed protein product [Colias eurytheme]
MTQAHAGGDGRALGPHHAQLPARHRRDARPGRVQDRAARRAHLLVQQVRVLCVTCGTALYVLCALCDVTQAHAGGDGRALGPHHAQLPARHRRDARPGRVQDRAARRAHLLVQQVRVLCVTCGTALYVLCALCDVTQAHAGGDGRALGPHHAQLPARHRRDARPGRVQDRAARRAHLLVQQVRVLCVTCGTALYVLCALCDVTQAHAGGDGRALGPHHAQLPARHRRDARPGRVQDRAARRAHLLVQQVRVLCVTCGTALYVLCALCDVTQAHAGGDGRALGPHHAQLPARHRRDARPGRVQDRAARRAHLLVQQVRVLCVTCGTALYVLCALCDVTQAHAGGDGRALGPHHAQLPARHRRDARPGRVQDRAARRAHLLVQQVRVLCVTCGTALYVLCALCDVTQAHAGGDGRALGPHHAQLPARHRRDARPGRVQDRAARRAHLLVQQVRVLCVTCGTALYVLCALCDVTQAHAGGDGRALGPHHAQLPARHRRDARPGRVQDRAARRAHLLVQQVRVLCVTCGTALYVLCALCDVTQAHAGGDGRALGPHHAQLPARHRRDARPGRVQDRAARRAHLLVQQVRVLCVTCGTALYVLCALCDVTQAHAGGDGRALGPHHAQLPARHRRDARPGRVQDRAARRAHLLVQQITTRVLTEVKQYFFDVHLDSK